MIVQRPSFDVERLQAYLLQENLSQPVNAASSNPAREPNARGSQHQIIVQVKPIIPVSSHSVRVTRNSNNASASLSFLSSVVPESIEDNVIPVAQLADGSRMEANEGERNNGVGANTQASEDATQEISQSALEVVRSRSDQVSMRQESLFQEEEQQEDVNDGLEDTQQEGDSNFLDIASSFAALPIEHESVPVNFSPTQSQGPLTQFPESQRFKTPATAGKKRDNRGNVLDTPAVSRNPFAKSAQITPANVVGLSQAFAATQAASSPFVNAPTSALRSDRPSPEVEVQRTVLNQQTSSPFQPLSDYKRAATEPASRYVPIGHSQQFRRSSHDPEERANHQTQTPNDDDLDSEPSLVVRQRRAREREARAREQLKSASSPISPGKHGLLPSTSARPRRSASERPAARRMSTRSLPSSPPAIGDNDNSERQRLHDVQVDESHLPELHQPDAVEMLGVTTLVPDTTRRGGRNIAISIQATQPSPSTRPTRYGKAKSTTRFVDSDAVLIANSQKSAPSSQGPHGTLTTVSSGDSVDVIPASPLGQPVATQRTEPSPKHTTRTRHLHHASQDNIDEDMEIDHALPQPTASALTNSTVPETSSEHTGKTEQRTSTYATALTHHDSSAIAATPAWSSQPVQPPPGRKRRRMEEISQEDVVRLEPEQESFDAVEVLALNGDPEIAQALLSSPDFDQVLHRKRVKSWHDAATPQLEIEETRSLNNTNANIGRRVSPRNAAPSVDDDDTEHDAPPVDDQDVSILDVQQKTPTRKPAKQSAWDMGVSPKPRLMPKTLGPRSQQASRTLKHRSTQRRNRNAPFDVLKTPSTLPSIEEASPDALAVSTTSTALVTPQQNKEAVIAPNKVFAYYMGKGRAYYPAECLSVKVDLQQCTIRWPGFDPDIVPMHGVCSLDLKIGDEVKVDGKQFPKTAYTIRGFRSMADSVTDKVAITDIYGHTHVLLEPKKSNIKMPKGVNRDTAIPIGNIYIDVNMWRRVCKRPFVVQIEQPTRQPPRTSTPLPRASSPTTPSSRSRHSVKNSPVKPVRKDGVFANMVFALSFEDSSVRSRISELVTNNSGTILQNSFHELVDDDLKLQPCFAGMRFTALLADRHSRKEKYMQALAFGLPCLSGKWVEASLKASRLAAWRDYLLPAGESVELDGAVRSRFLPGMDFQTVKLPDVLGARPRFFNERSVVFVTGRGKTEQKQVPHLFFVRIMGATNIDKVVDLASAREKLEAVQRTQDAWLIVEDRDLIAASRLANELGKEHAGKNKRTNAQQAWQCRVADREFVMQSLILGRLCCED